MFGTDLFTSVDLILAYFLLTSFQESQYFHQQVSNHLMLISRYESRAMYIQGAFFFLNEHTRSIMYEGKRRGPTTN